MYYVRKLEKPFNFNKIQTAQSIDNIDSDVLKQELSTKENTLSFWQCKDLSCIEDTIKAIVLSTSEIKASKFIIIDSNIIKEHELEINENEGNTGYKGFENLHVDIYNLTYKKLGTLLKAYKKVFGYEQGTRLYSKDDVKDLILEVIESNLLDTDKLHHRLQRDIIKLAEKNEVVI